MSRYGPFARKLSIALATLLVLGTSLYLLRAPLLRAAANLITVEDPLLPSDYILVLGGEPHVRPFHAADLYRRGVAPRILLIEVESQPAERLGLIPHQNDVAKGVFRSYGIPDSAVVVVPFDEGVGSTRDEGRALASYFSRESARRITVVTSEYHTGRARFTLRRALRGTGVEVRISGAPNDFDTTNWWRDERGFFAYFSEYVKWIHTLLRPA
jgi:uncharacterized SAM-binding protein YcdF (DUF218 family)